MPFSPQTIDHTEARINTMRLQAAAPELLEALQLVKHWNERSSADISDEARAELEPIFKAVYAAIAKAEGSDE